VAVRTGELVVIDIDPESGGWDSLGALVDSGRRLPPTATVITGGGGAHLYYVCPPDHELRNTAGALPGVGAPLPGIDLRARGGYVVAPPSRHASGDSYRWVPHSGFPAPAPGWLRPTSPPQVRRSVRAAAGWGTSAYGAAALRDELRRVSTTPVGTRNHELNRAAFAIGQLVAEGHLDADDVAPRLVAAGLVAGLGAVEASRTVASGVEAGRRQPRTSGALDPRHSEAPQGRTER
jgi:hypothetical protein